MTVTRPLAPEDERAVGVEVHHEGERSRVRHVLGAEATDLGLRLVAIGRQQDEVRVELEADRSAGEHRFDEGPTASARGPSVLDEHVLAVTLGLRESVLEAPVPAKPFVVEVRVSRGHRSAV